MVSIVRSVLLSKPHPTTLKKVEEAMIPPDGVKQKLDGVVDNVLTWRGLDGELTEEWDENENKTVADSDDEEDLTVRKCCVYSRGWISARKWINIRWFWYKKLTWTA